MDVEVLKEDRSRLESDLRTSTRDLGEILFQNDELMKENADQDALLIKKEEYLKDLHAKNEAEILQIQSEEIAVLERCGHDLKLKENGVLQLEYARDR